MSSMLESTKLSGKPEVIFKRRKDINGVEIFLKGTGCRYGKCSFCSFPVEAYRGVFNSEEWLKVLKVSIPEFTGKEKWCEEVFLYAYGNVLDDRNFPGRALRWLLHHLKKNLPKLRLVSIENRVERKFGFTGEKIAELKELLEPVELEIAIGYETSNRKLREVLLNKGVEEEKFVRALKVLSGLGCRVRVYLLYPASPFLTEEAAFSQIVADVEHLVKLKERLSLKMRVHVCRLELKEGTPLKHILKGRVNEVDFEKVKRELPALCRKVSFIFSTHPD